ncbi:MAG: cupredoxin domain-containing protein [Actinomycetota bacterium]|jgi:plastocyanin|nr:cupredoxin domain-containing protein [Actinomycetota bacterium]
MKRIKPPHIILAVVVIVVAAFSLPQIFTEQVGTLSVQGNTVTKTLGSGDTNATAVFQVRLLEGSDPEHESEHIFGSISGLPGLGDAVLDVDTLELTVNYDDTAIGDLSVRDMLVSAGYLVPTADDATSTEMSEDGTVQRIAISDDGVQFDPYLIRAEAGIPIELEFAPGQECRVAVKLPQLGIEQNIAQGGTVSLGAVEAGEYDILCSGDGYEGTLIVE